MLFSREKEVVVAQPGYGRFMCPITTREKVNGGGLEASAQ